MSYPAVKGEYETLELLVQQQYSIARFGDGEFKLIDGYGYVREPANRELARELKEVLQSPSPRCLVGIPTMDPKGPKIDNWLARRERMQRHVQGGRKFVSAFITRPDSAPWIETLAFCERLQELWTGKRVVLIAESTSKLPRLVEPKAKRFEHILCPRYEAYALIDAFEQMLQGRRPDLALLSCGPTATCLANRLARSGIHAIDIGSAGGFLSRVLLAS